MNPAKGALIRRYKSGDLLRLIRRTNATWKILLRNPLGYTIPTDILKTGLASIRTLRVLDFNGARYLWAYLTLLDYKPYMSFKDADFYLFGVTLHGTLGVIYKALKRY